MPAIYRFDVYEFQNAERAARSCAKIRRGIGGNDSLRRKIRIESKAALAKILSINDQEVLQSAYDAYAKTLVNRRLLVPVNAVTQAVEIAREDGTQLRKKPAEIIDNGFAEHLGKSGFLKELWGNELPQREKEELTMEEKFHFSPTA